MDYKEACAYLRVSPTLLKWFKRYAPKVDERKLIEAHSDDFDKEELDAFTAHLRSPWKNRGVPNGIKRELRLEASGHCGVCQQPCEKPQEAHILRKGVELDHYCQHPENLILLCGTCHDRYDDLNLTSIDLDVVKAAKERLVARKMEAIDRDVNLASGMRQALEMQKEELRKQLQSNLAPSNFSLWQFGAVDLLSTVRQHLGSAAMIAHSTLDILSPAASLAALSGSLAADKPTTHAVLDGYAQEAAGTVAVAPTDWELIEPEPKEYECKLCGGLKDTVEYYCSRCDHSGINTDPPSQVEEDALGLITAIYEDARGSTYKLECEECEENHLELTYPESYCSRCQHLLDND